MRVLLIILWGMLMLTSTVLAEDFPGPDAQLRQRLAQSMSATHQQQFDRVLSEAKSYLSSEHRGWLQRKKTVVILDLDETLLDMRGYYMTRGAFNEEQWEDFIAEADAAAYPQTRELVFWLDQHHWPIVFITGRREHQRTETVSNLTRLGVPPSMYARLLMKQPEQYALTATVYKQQVRNSLQKEGFKIRACIGDQVSDCAGSPGESFRLPNPIYTIP